MSNEMATINLGAPALMSQVSYFAPEQVDLIKRTIAKGSTDDELRLFLYQCQRTGLDPFSRQIYAISRDEWDPDTRTKKKKMTIQTAIDGLRIIAERTGRYAPGDEPLLTWDGDLLVKATAYVKKLVAGTWHIVPASAYYDEYVGTKADGKPTRMWADKPRLMLAKCAEALALRKAFPAEMSGIYTGDEMSRAEEPTATPEAYTPPKAPAPAAPPAAVGGATSETPASAPKAGKPGPKAPAAAPSAADPKTTPKSPPATSPPSKPTVVQTAARKRLHAALAGLGLGNDQAREWDEAAEIHADNARLKPADAPAILLKAKEAKGRAEGIRRAAYLGYLSGMTGREIASSTDLTDAEVSSIATDAERGVFPGGVESEEPAQDTRGA